MDGGQDLAAVGGQMDTHPDQVLVAQEASGDRLPFDERHDQGSGPEGGVVVADEDDLRHRDTGPTGGPQERSFESESRLRSPGRIAPQDQTPGRPVAGTRREGPCLA